jgi:hypothetical protein
MRNHFGGEWFAIVTLEGCHARTTDGTNLGAVDYATLASWAEGQGRHRRQSDIHCRATT